jgi:Tol biopolymer transport system component
MPPRARAQFASWLASLALAACARAPAPLQTAPPPADAPGSPPYALSSAATEPVLFAPDVISTGDFESHAAFTPDGSTVYFVKSDPDFTRWTICESQFAAGRWSEPRVAPFSGSYRDSDPFITRDGEHLYFISDRPADGKAKADMDIWVMDRTPQGWSAPRNPGAPVNSGESEWHPSLTSSGTLYFGSARSGGLGMTDIYRATFDGQAWSVENLGAPVNTPGDEYEPMIAPDESYLVFMAFRPGGLGGSDLYLSWHRNGAWTEPVNLGPPVNSSALELAPALSPDGRYFFFSSTRRLGSSTSHGAGNGLGDIYQIDLAAVLGRVSTPHRGSAPNHR